MPFLFEGHVRVSAFGKPNPMLPREVHVTIVELGQIFGSSSLTPKGAPFQIWWV